ncbi:nuclear factor 7%2C ovary-like [Xyrichtys novacula]|uniref:Nuclear factor 7, ovary-like n=1 Tax=Xyrichtys novacula TaxID=13765 RepID=A0AAV1GJ09_XYRNO|nr:nuclear factor 7%2C ovary-like [Xyrichtys novacula]
MASRFDEDLFCPVCSEVFRDPVILSCSHSFCRDCLQDWWKTKEEQRCPVCGSWSSKGHLLPNITLKKLCESFLQEGLCTLHLQKLKFFCLDHQELVCEVCRDSGRHTNHSFRPVDETAREHRFFLEETPESLGESLRYLQEVQEKFDQTAEHIQVQARLTERRIKEQFLKLHRFLEEEEEARLSALREEEEQKSRRMKEQMEALSRQIADLSDTVRATEDLLRAEDLSFLKNYTPTMLKIFQHSQIEVPQLPSGALIDQAKHLGNLSFNIWTKMKGMVSYCPVILDPNSAHPEVLLSEDLSSVSRGEEQQLPDNPERISHDGSVLGSESFESGSHSWEVEVGESSDWELGVMEKSIYGERVRWSTSWGVRLSDGLYKTHSSTTGGQTVLQVKKHLQKIRVDLDLDSGQLSFSDPDTGSHVHTFKPTFTERVTPFMKTGTEPSLRISPLKIRQKFGTPDGLLTCSQKTQEI